MHSKAPFESTIRKHHSKAPVGSTSSEAPVENTSQKHNRKTKARLEVENSIGSPKHHQKSEAPARKHQSEDKSTIRSRKHHQKSEAPAQKHHLEKHQLEALKSRVGITSDRNQPFVSSASRREHQHQPALVGSTSCQKHQSESPQSEAPQSETP
ncbi:hypothetical protein BJ508DRAFT_311124 [Ascobolus immersus RN42]|uniref:Uncharacterized protein n=1 Tax=Ascobolus immersus RN42 TaxID=1160509 RepID=A0A3N4HTN9_ASCIM|nr:hypothetical protein BJ508DRAFT_311124 [Ascobolus immersus RN42]